MQSHSLLKQSHSVGKQPRRKPRKVGQVLHSGRMDLVQTWAEWATYAVVWRPRHSKQVWVGIKTHMGFHQEAYDAECAALVRTLEIGADRWQRHRIPRATIFSDA